MRVLVFGTFDQLHPGHRAFLDAAARRGELWVVIGLDDNVKRFKRRRPIQNQQERKRAIERAYPQARVVFGDAEECCKPIERINPDLILLGYDQRLPPGAELSDMPCMVERLPAYEPERYKSSLLRE